MPVTKSARDKIRSDNRKTVINNRIRRRYKAAVKKMREKPSSDNLALASSMLDRAVKKRVVHGNKASRLKSRLARLT